MTRLLVLALLFAPALCAGETDLAKELADLRRDHAAQGKRLAELEKQLTGKSAEEAPPAQEHEDHGIDDLPGPRRRPDPRHDLFHTPMGKGHALRLIDLSVNGLFAAGLSTAQNHEITGLQGGGHDPKRRGFTMQQVEFGFVGAVDPFFTAEAYLVAGEEGVELEEAFAYTTSLPAGLQVEFGYFFTEFGRINPIHPHGWDFIDQPVINSRLLGPDGTRGSGFRIGWQAPTPWFSELHFGVQNANDPVQISFNGEGHHHGHEEEEHAEETVGGWPRVEREVETFADLLYLFRWHNYFVIAEHSVLALGMSGLFGPNASGDNGKTWLVGGDLLFKWKPEGAHDNVLKVQGEFMYRYFQANGATLPGADPGDPSDDEFLEPTVLGDWGGYLQLTVNVYHHVFVGLRGEFADAFRDGEELRHEDPLRDRRFRISPIVEWQVSHFSRLRLQYNFDHMQHLDKSAAHTVWFGVEFLFGAHRGH